MNTLYILLALTFSNGNMQQHEVSGKLWKGKEDCLLEYKQMSKRQTNNTKFVCMLVNNEWYTTQYKPLNWGMIKDHDGSLKTPFIVSVRYLYTTQ